MIEEKLAKVVQIKENIRLAINNKGIEVLNNFQTLFSEIENFQKKYQNMKNESSKRNNFIKELLSKTNIHIK